MRPALILAACFLTACSPPEAVETRGLLSDSDFYRLVACGAAPGRACTKPYVRWPATKARALNVGIAPVPSEFPDASAREVRASLAHAIGEINAVTPALQLSLSTRAPFDVTVHLVTTPRGKPVTGAGTLNGLPATSGMMRLTFDIRGQITGAAIGLSRQLSPARIRSVVLEELTQAMGLATDIDNPAYINRSVLVERGGRLDRLGPQDRIALRTHYLQR